MSIDKLTYAASGVDEAREQSILGNMRKSFARTLDLRNGFGRPIADHDHFGSLISLGSAGALAISTDGVGTKLVVAQQMKSYREVSHDLVANNVNDIICMGAEPVGIVDYIGIDIADQVFLEEFADAFSNACVESRVSVLGGEIAQIGEMLNPSHVAPRFDIVATAVGLCRLSPQDEGDFPVALSRANVRSGQVLIGLQSSGIHSNGLSLARRVLFEHGGLSLFDEPPTLQGTKIGTSLLTPTRIYVNSVMPLLRAGLVSGIANISGGGFLTIARLQPDLSFEITALPEPSPIFRLIAETAPLPRTEMYSTFNMGLGMVLAVEEKDVPLVCDLLIAGGEVPMRIGHVVENTDSAGTISIPGLGLLGRRDTFVNV